MHLEVLIDAFDLGGDPALVRLARIVHAADITGELDSDPLRPGLLAIGEGGLDVEPDDQRLLERGMFVYDALYAWCQRHPSPEAPTMNSASHHHTSGQPDPPLPAPAQPTTPPSQPEQPAHPPALRLRPVLAYFLSATFIGYLVGGLAGALVATVAIFAPIYLGVVVPGRWFVRHRDHPQVAAFVKGATAAAAGAIAGATVVLTRQAVIDWPTATIALVALGALWP